LFSPYSVKRRGIPSRYGISGASKYVITSESDVNGPIYINIIY
jgi:hypothetical protein